MFLCTRALVYWTRSFVLTPVSPRVDNRDVHSCPVLRIANTCEGAALCREFPQVLYKHHPIYFFKRPYETDTIIILILQIGKLKHKKAKHCVHCSCVTYSEAEHLNQVVLLSWRHSSWMTRSMLFFSGCCSKVPQSVWPENDWNLFHTALKTEEPEVPALADSASCTSLLPDLWMVIFLCEGSSLWASHIPKSLLFLKISANEFLGEHNLQSRVVRFL